MQGAQEMIEVIFFTCWLMMLPNGDMYCYCEGEQPPVISQPAQIERPRLMDESSLAALTIPDVR